MKKDLVIGIDSSTSATKATVWNQEGHLVCEGRMGIPMSNPISGHFEQDPEDWWRSTADAVAQVLNEIDAKRVAGIAISNQRETFGIFNKAGEALRPGIVWLDSRAFEETQEFSDKVGFDRIRAICGKPVDTIVPIYSLIWLKKHEPDNFAKIYKFGDVHTYLTYRLCGNWITSTASADPSGMLDVKEAVWSKSLLNSAEIPIEIMPKLAKPGEFIGAVSEEASEITGLLEGTPIFAGGGDGQCAACGAGATKQTIAYMNLGTALVTGVYSDQYGHNQAFRTETAVADNGYIFETVLKAGTFLIDWYSREFAQAEDHDLYEIIEQLESEAITSKIGSGGVVFLPFLQGSMTPHWDAKARGIIAGLSGSTTRADIYRSLLEGLALDQAFALEKAMQAMDNEITQIVAIGGGTASGLLLQIIADAINIPVARAQTTEASALGAAMCAAKGVGWFSSLEEASDNMRQEIISITNPIPENVIKYAELRKVYDDLWPHIKDWNTRLWEFANHT